MKENTETWEINSLGDLGVEAESSQKLGEKQKVQQHTEHWSYPGHMVYNKMKKEEDLLGDNSCGVLDTVLDA